MIGTLLLGCSSLTFRRLRHWTRAGASIAPAVLIGLLMSRCCLISSKVFFRMMQWEWTNKMICLQRFCLGLRICSILVWFLVVLNEFIWKRFCFCDFYHFFSRLNFNFSWRKSFRLDWFLSSNLKCFYAEIAKHLLSYFLSLMLLVRRNFAFKI